MVAAIAWHGAAESAAERSARAFERLLPQEQQALIAFLNSLGRREFDGNGDGVIDDMDFDGFVACYTGPPHEPKATQYDADHFCAVFDVNQDGAVDEHDFAVFLKVYDGRREPCELWRELADRAGPTAVAMPEECCSAH
jgi:hypothetical protein